LHTIENLQGDGPKNLDSQVAFLGGKLLISPEFMQFMGYIILFINSILAALFLGILLESKATQGVKYFPIIFIVSLVLFSLGNLILPRFLGALQ
jgi:hypothetical protein